MSKLKSQRIEVIKHLMRNYGIEYGGECAISFWQLAHDINNTWRAEIFVNKAKYPENYIQRRGPGEEVLVLPDHKLGDLFNGIRHALKGNPYPLEYGVSYHNNVEFVLWKDYERQ